jgi:hypothetical protein
MSFVLKLQQRGGHGPKNGRNSIEEDEEQK